MYHRLCGLLVVAVFGLAAAPVDVFAESSIAGWGVESPQNEANQPVTNADHDDSAKDGNDDPPWWFLADLPGDLRVSSC